MTLQECYTKLGGDYEDVLSRLQREKLVDRFVIKFLSDASYALYLASMEKKDYAEALRAVHTLKGVCQNLSFTKLYESSFAITSALKAGDCQKAAAMTPALTADYERAAAAIRAYQEQKEEA